MRTSRSFVVCAAVALSLLAVQAQAQFKQSDLEKMQKEGAEAAKQQQEMMEKLRKETEQRFATKPPPLGIAPPAGAFKPTAPMFQKQAPAAKPYNPRSRSTVAKEKPSSAQPVAQTAPAPRKAPDATPAPPPAPAPAKPDCVYKPVMSDEDIAACR